MQPLEARERDVLSRLYALSEAPAQSALDTRTRHGSSSAAMPQGVGLFGDGKQPPRKELSLFEHYRWRLEHATTPEQRIFLCALADRDWLWTVHRRPAARVETRQEWETRVLVQYEHEPPEVAAVFEQVSVRTIFRLRSKALRAVARELAAVA